MADWEWPENPVRYQRFTAPDGTVYVFDQVRNDDGTFMADDPATEVVESAQQWLPALVDGIAGGEA